jgi:protein tyrosine phosphatase (PTP) superfamily phosphohydrolase (DUF442 family)
MNGRSLGLSAAFILALVTGAGCSHCCQRPRAYADPATPWCPSCRGGAAAPGPSVAPPEPRPLPGPAGAPSGALPAPPPEARGYQPFPPESPQYTWRPPADTGIRLSPPEPVVPAGPPQSAEPPRAEVPPRPEVREEPRPSPALPSGIPQFAVARAGVASGLKPSLEGLEWLRSNAYRAVLHVRQPGEDDTAERRQIEKLGLRYQSLELSPQTLAREVVEQFNQIVSDTSQQPLFVYDRDGMLAGSLWYLHFRIASQDTDEAARLKAARLGLKENAGGDNSEMWLAIQKYLAGQAH